MTEGRAGAIMAGPALAAILLFFALPTFAAFLLGGTDFDIYALADPANMRVVGLRNFSDLFANPLFWRALGNSLLFALLGVPASVAAALGAALLLQARAVRWRGAWRAALFAPCIANLVATAVVWRYLLDTRFGLLNAGLARLGVAPVDWLGDPRLSIPAVVLFYTWKVFGYYMLLFVSALGQVSPELAEAARLDGAGAWTRFRHVTLPALGPTLALVAVLSVAALLQIFTEPYVMTQGGPAQSTVTLLYFMYVEGFQYWNLGAASAVAVVIFALILAVTAVQVRVARRAEWA